MAFEDGVVRVDVQSKFDVNLNRASAQHVAQQIRDWVEINLDTLNVEPRVIIRIQMGHSADE